MARLPRLALAGLPHLLLLRGIAGRPIAFDDDDRRSCLARLREAATSHRLTIHAYALLEDRLRLLATPVESTDIGRAIQDFGRRYVSVSNRRHARQGPLWDGRYRATVVQPGALAIEALVFVDTEPAWTGSVEAPERYEWSSAGAHIGLRADPLVGMLDEYWRLGNTPFDRESAYARLLAEGLPAATIRRLEQACLKGWPNGDAAFLARLSALTDRPLRPRRAGRPARRMAQVES